LRPSVPFVPGAGLGKSEALKIPLRKSSFEPSFESPNAGMLGRSKLVPSAL
jgi:hypothetical protein